MRPPDRLTGRPPCRRSSKGKAAAQLRAVPSWAEEAPLEELVCKRNSLPGTPRSVYREVDP